MNLFQFIFSTIFIFEHLMSIEFGLTGELFFSFETGSKYVLLTILEFFVSPTFVSWMLGWKACAILSGL